MFPQLSRQMLQRILDVVRRVEAMPFQHKRRRRQIYDTPPSDFLVRVKQVSGGPGGATAQCDYGYDVYSHVGAVSDSDPDTRLAEDLQPMYGRTAVGKYVFTPTDVSNDMAHARAFYDSSNQNPSANPTRLLIVYGEIPAVTTCDAG